MTKYFTPTHEWISVEGDEATVGITAHAAEELGEAVFVEAKDIGTDLAAGDAAAVVESVKAASDIYAPVAGTLLAFNTQLSDEPTLIGADPEGAGWIYKLKIVNPGDLSGLLTEEQYKAL